MTSQKATELRRVARHEAGHWVTAYHAFGIAATITIEAHGPAGYSGLCAFNLSKNPEVNRAIALAGGVAEALSEALPWDTEKDLLDMARSKLSVPDIAIAGEFGLKDLQIAASLCRKYWSEIVASSNQQIALVNWREKQVAMVNALAA